MVKLLEKQAAAATDFVEEFTMTRDMSFEDALAPDSVSIELSLAVGNTESVLEIRPGESLVLGRSQPADFIVQDPTLSKSHARFFLDDEGYLWVEDLNSKNGTWVMGEKVDRHRLSAADAVALGEALVSIHPRSYHLLPSGQSTELKAKTLVEFLAAMSRTSRLVEQFQGGQPPLVGCRVFLIHHLTAEVVGLIGALRRLGCRDLEAFFVVYSDEHPESYLRPLRDLPAEEFRAYSLCNTPSRESVEGGYRLSSRYPALANRKFLNSALSRMSHRYVDAMKLVAIVQFLQQLQRARQSGDQCLVIEDGGYLSPLLNDASLRGQTVRQVLGDLGVKSDDSSKIAELIEGTVIGSVEHTRNGFDRLEDVVRTHGRLAKPALSIAVSNEKVLNEARDVAATIVNGAENVLHAMGLTMSRRNVLVTGSSGVVGERVASILGSRISGGFEHVFGVDPRADEASRHQPDGILEARCFADLPETARKNIDLIIGVTGKSSVGERDIVDWLFHGNRSKMLLVSGSSKTEEFSGLALWLDQLMEGSSSLRGCPLEIEHSEFRDPKSGQLLAQRRKLTISSDVDTQIVKEIIFVGNLRPVNFLYYGVPTETIDGVLCELAASALYLLQHSQELSPRVHAVDHQVKLPTDWIA